MNAIIKNNEQYFCVDSIDTSFGKVYIFDAINNRIFCEKINEKYYEIEDINKLEECKKLTKIKNKDVIY